MATDETRTPTLQDVLASLLAHYAEAASSSNATITASLISDRNGAYSWTYQFTSDQTKDYGAVTYTRGDEGFRIDVQRSYPRN